MALGTGLLGWLSQQVCLDGSPDRFAWMALPTRFLGRLSRQVRFEGPTYTLTQIHVSAAYLLYRATELHA